MTPEEQIDAVILSVCHQAGEDMVADIQSEISAAYPPASQPHNPPHRRSGNLHDGISFTLEQTGPVILLIVVSTAFYSRFLEDGTGRMADRSFMGPAQERWTPVIYQRFTEAFSTSSPVHAG